MLTLCHHGYGSVVMVTVCHHGHHSVVMVTGCVFQVTDVFSDSDNTLG